MNEERRLARRAAEYRRRALRAVEEHIAVLKIAARVRSACLPDVYDEVPDAVRRAHLIERQYNEGRFTWRSNDSHSTVAVPSVRRVPGAQQRRQLRAMRRSEVAPADVAPQGTGHEASSSGSSQVPMRSPDVPPLPA